MTCIIGVETVGGAWIGSDSSCTSIAGDAWRYLSDRPKYVLRSVDTSTVAIGLAGAWRAKQIAERGVTAIPKRRRGEDDIEYVHRAIVEPIREAHRAAAGHEADGANGDSGGRDKDDSDVEGLVVFGGRVYVMFADYGVMRPKHGYAAVGSGSEYALGAVCGIRAACRPPHVGHDAKATVAAALHAAAEHCTTVSPPFHMVFVPA